MISYRGKKKAYSGSQSWEWIQPTQAHNQIAGSGRNDRQKSEPDTNFADNLCVHEIGEIGGIMGDIFDIYAMVYDKVSTWCLQHVPS